MTKHGEGRILTPVRLGRDGLAWIDREAARRRITRSEMIRHMLAYAKRHMPKGWKP